MFPKFSFPSDIGSLASSNVLHVLINNAYSLPQKSIPTLAYFQVVPDKYLLQESLDWFWCPESKCLDRHLQNPKEPKKNWEAWEKLVWQNFFMIHGETGAMFFSWVCYTQVHNEGERKCLYWLSIYPTVFLNPLVYNFI